MTPAKVSIIIPCYNIAEHLSKCIESVLAQTYPDFELLLVNDGSTDNTLKIIEAFAEKDMRIKVFTHENKGVSYTRNVGIENAKGEYLMFIDGDDYVKDDYIEKLVASAEEGSWPLCGMINVRNGNIKENEHFSQLKHLFPDGFIEKERFLRVLEYYSLSSPCARLYERNIIAENQIRFDDSITYQEDLIFNLTYIDRINKINLVDYFGYYYIEHGTSSTSRFHTKFDHIQLLRDGLQQMVYSTEDGLIAKEFIFHTVLRKIANIFHPDSDKNDAAKLSELTQLFQADYFYYIYEYIKVSPVNLILKTLLKLKSPRLVFLFYKIKNTL